MPQPGLGRFFNSIAKPQFLTAWRINLEFYRQRDGVQQDTVFTIDLKEKTQQLRMFRGKRRARATREVRIRTEDVPTITLHALALQHFKVAGRGFRQAHGSLMGSPLSPALRGMVIAAQEKIWRRTFSITRSSMSRNISAQLALRRQSIVDFRTQARAAARSQSVLEQSVLEQPFLRRRHCS